MSWTDPEPPILGYWRGLGILSGAMLLAAALLYLLLA